jgi:hypothetical protein
LPCQLGPQRQARICAINVSCFQIHSGTGSSPIRRAQAGHVATQGDSNESGGSAPGPAAGDCRR